MDLEKNGFNTAFGGFAKKEIKVNGGIISRRLFLTR
jgi:hypothetical protein